MAKIDNLTLEVDEVSQSFNVSEILGVDVSDRPRLIEEFGQAVIDRIVERTEQGKGVDGKKLKAPYSKSYVASEEFKEYGKSKNKINMTLTGGMLEDLDFEQNGDQIKVKFFDETETAKAYNHNVGDTLPKRPFFGINKNELRDIAAMFDSDLKEEASSKRATSSATDSQDVMTGGDIDLDALFATERKSGREIFEELYGDLL